MKAKRIKLEAEAIKTKTVRILPDVHKKLKVRVANTGDNMIEFVSNAIIEKLAK
jgi:hypothetical protein